MSYGGHLSMLIALIVGLAVTELLSGASRTLKRRYEPDFSWLPFVQAAQLALLALGNWIAVYSDLASSHYLNVFSYMMLLVSPGLLYFAATSIFPAREDAVVSVYSFAVTNARAANIPVALWMIWAVISNFYDAWPNWKSQLGINSTVMLAALFFMIAAYSKRNSWRWAATLILLAYDISFFIIFLPSIDTA
jgi:hypothetical protein